MRSRLGPTRSGLLALALLAGVFGCVERRMVINTHPFPDAGGAIVFDEKNQPIGASPADKQFTYYGKYRFRIVKDGYEPLVVEQRVRPPWYQLPGLDFISEHLIPWTIRDVRVFTYVLEKSPVRDPETLYQEGSRLREYGKAIGVPLPEPGPPPGIVPGVLLPPVRDP